MSTFELHREDKVFTADGREIGRVKLIFRRPDDEPVDPGKKLFRHYVEIIDLDLSNDFYIPVEYIHRQENGEVHLALDWEAVKEETLNREPQFVAHGKAEEIELPAPG